MKMEAKQGRNRGLSQPPMPLERGDSFSDSKGISLSHSLAQITNFMSTSFPHRNKKDANKSTPSPEVSTLKEEFERKIAAVVFCLEEKAEENIDLSYKLKALQETSKQREVEKDRSIEDLLKALKIKEEECHQWEKKADNDEVLNELNRRIQTLTHCLNDMAEENLKLRTTVNANSNGKQGARPRAGSPFSAHSSSFSMEPDHSPSSASFLSSLTASSSILSVSKSSSSQPSSSSTSASSHSTSAPPTAAHLKVPSTSTAATNTSPVPTPAPAPPVQVVNLPSAVADMKSEIIAEELLKDGEWLRKFSDSYLVPAPPLQVLGLLSDIIKQDKQRSEASLKLAMDERITALESELQTKDSSLSTLTGTLAKETDRTGSLAESVAEYERKMKDLEGRMWDNLNKEAQRRTEAESKAKRLKKKVDELQFLLDELKDDGSDEDEDDEDEAEEETQREKEKEEKEEENVPSSSSSSSSSSSEEEENIEESKKDEADA